METEIDITAVDNLASKVIVWLCSEDGIPRMRREASAALATLKPADLHILRDSETVHLTSMDAAWRKYCNDQCGRYQIKLEALIDTADDLGFSMFDE